MRNVFSPLRIFIGVIAASALATAACEPLEEAGVRDGGPPPGKDAGDAGNGDAGDGGPRPGEIPSSAVKPNVVLLIDRSGSMNEPVPCESGPCQSKWQQLVGLGGYLVEAKNLARLGLAMFPSPGVNGCDVASCVQISVSDAPNIDEQIIAAVQAVVPGGRTPAAAAMDMVANSGQLDDPERDNILLLLTDGEPNCTCNEPSCETEAAVAAVQRLVNRSPSVDVDIIGFGASAISAQETLTAMAQAAGDTHYYQSNNIEELIGTLYAVGVQKISCKFDLDEWPDPAKLVVWMDDVEVAACPGLPCDEGYTYDPAVGKVVLQGATCEGLRDGQPHTVWFESRE